MIVMIMRGTTAQQEEYHPSPHHLIVFIIVPEKRLFSSSVSCHILIYKLATFLRILRNESVISNDLMLGATQRQDELQYSIRPFHSKNETFQIVFYLLSYLLRELSQTYQSEFRKWFRQTHEELHNHNLLETTCFAPFYPKLS